MTMGKSCAGLFVGLSTVDIIYGVDSFPAEDTKTTATGYCIATGGPASNAAVAFAYLGGDARLVSALGTGVVAELARRDLTACGVAHLEIDEKRRADPALSAIVVSTAVGSRTILTSPAIDDDSGAMAANAQLEDALGASNIVLLDGHQPSVAEQTARLAKARGVPVVMDGDLYNPKVERLLAFVDIVIFGKSFRIPNQRTSDEAAGYFRDLGVKHVVATHGASAIEYLSPAGTVMTPVPAVPVIDTLAAGDFFHGAFCYFYLRHRDVARAIHAASQVAAASVSSFGTREWLRRQAADSFHGL
jgi:sugar/nucleoside kinase (ribokinase family)